MDRPLDAPASQRTSSVSLIFAPGLFNNPQPATPPVHLLQNFVYQRQQAIGCLPSLYFLLLERSDCKFNVYISLEIDCLLVS